MRKTRWNRNGLPLPPSSHYWGSKTSKRSPIHGKTGDSSTTPPSCQEKNCTHLSDFWSVWTGIFPVTQVLDENGGAESRPAPWLPPQKILASPAKVSKTARQLIGGTPPLQTLNSVPKSLQVRPPDEELGAQVLIGHESSLIFPEERSHGFDLVSFAYRPFERLVYSNFSDFSRIYQPLSGQSRFQLWLHPPLSQKRSPVEAEQLELAYQLLLESEDILIVVPLETAFREHYIGSGFVQKAGRRARDYWL